MNKFLLTTLKVIAVLCLATGVVDRIVNADNLIGFTAFCSLAAFFMFIPIVAVAANIDEAEEEKKNQLRRIRTHLFNVQMILTIFAIAAGFVEDYETTLGVTVGLTCLALVSLGMWKLVNIVEP